MATTCPDCGSEDVPSGGVEVEALRAAIEATHDREHDAVSLTWCGHELCRTMESFR